MRVGLGDVGSTGRRWTVSRACAAAIGASAAVIALRFALSPVLGRPSALGELPTWLIVLLVPTFAWIAVDRIREATSVGVRSD